MQPIETKPLGTINYKQLAAFALIILAIAGLYYGNKQEILINREETIKNRELLQEFKAELKEQQKYNDL